MAKEEVTATVWKDDQNSAVILKRGGLPIEWNDLAKIEQRNLLCALADIYQLLLKHY